MEKQRPSIILVCGWGTACLMIVGGIAVYECCKKGFKTVKTLIFKNETQNKEDE